MSYRVTIKTKLRSETLGLYFPVTYRFDVSIKNHSVDVVNENTIWDVLRINRVERLVEDGESVLPIDWEMLPDDQGLTEALLDVWRELCHLRVDGAPSWPEDTTAADDYRSRNRELGTYLKEMA